MADAMNRRRSERHRVVFPIELSSSHKRGRIGMCRNGSAMGLLVGTPSQFELGDELELRFRTRLEAEERIVRGRVVRLANEDLNRDHWFHRLVAVEFDQPRPDLADAFSALEPAQAHLFG